MKSKLYHIFWLIKSPIRF